jgi:hypothetical protein
MSPRMTSPVMVVPDALPALLGLSKVISKAGVPQQTLDLVHLSASQVTAAPAVFTCTPVISGNRKRRMNACSWRLPGGKRHASATPSALVLAIGLVNLWNRVNVSTRQVPGADWR